MFEFHDQLTLAWRWSSTAR